LNLREQLAYALNDLHRSYLFNDQISDARAALQEARELWRTLDNQPMLADSLVASSALAFYDGEIDQAMAWREESYQISQRIGNQWGQAYSQMQASMIYQAQGDFGKAIAAMQASIRAGDQGGFEIASLAMRANLGLLYGYLGDLNRAERYTQEALAVGKSDNYNHLSALATMIQLSIWKNDLESAQKFLDTLRQSVTNEPNDPMSGNWIYLAEANLACAKQEWKQAIWAADKLIKSANTMMARIFMSLAFEIKGSAQLALGQLEQAQATLLNVRDLAVRFHERRILWKIYSDLSELEIARGHSDQAAEWKILARQTLNEIAATIPTPELRQSFLSTADAQKVMAG
jgi:tetratricopeptide (TPR) repeat protein